MLSRLPLCAREWGEYMNKVRRKTLAGIIDKLSAINEDLQMVLDEEAEARDNVPESLQESERYEQMDEACDSMEECVSSIEEIIDSLQEVIDA